MKVQGARAGTNQGRIDDWAFGRESWIHHSVPETSTVAPAPCLTPLSPDQLETWLKRLRSLLLAAPERAARSLLRGAGLQGLPLEQVLTAHEAEE